MAIVMDLADFLTWMLQQKAVEKLQQVGFHAHLAGLSFGAFAAVAFVLRQWRRATLAALVAMTLLSFVSLLWWPWQVNWLQAQFERAYERADFPAMIGWQDRIVGCDPLNSIHRVNRGTLRWTDGDLRGAESEFDEAVRLDPDLERARVALAGILELHSDYAGALREIDVVLHMSSNNSKARVARARIAWQQGRYGDAQRDLDILFSIDSSNAEGLLLRGTMRTEACHFDAALSLLTSCIERGEQTTPIALLYRAHLYEEIGRLRLAETDRRNAVAGIEAAMLIAPREPSRLSALGDLCTTLGDLDAAERHFQQAIELAPEFVDALAGRGFLMLRKSRFLEAQQDFREALRRCPDHPWALEGLGRACLAMDDPRGALGVYERMLKQNPRCRPAHTGAGTAHRMLGELDAADAAIAKALTLNDRSAETYRERARLREKQLRMEEAKSDRRRARELDTEIERR